MAFPVRSAGRARHSFIVFAATALSVMTTSLPASAAPAEASPVAPASVQVRVIVKLNQPSGDADAIAADAARRAGVPVRYAAAVNGAWHALSLQCADAAACDAAIDNMRKSGAYSSVELDSKKRHAAMV